MPEEIDATHERQGVTPHVMRYVLALGFGLRIPAITFAR